MLKALGVLGWVPGLRRPGGVAGPEMSGKTWGIRKVIKVRAKARNKMGPEQLALGVQSNSQTRKMEAGTQIPEQGRDPEAPAKSR